MSRSQLAEWRDAVRDSGLDSNAKHVAHVLSTYMNGGGQCWPSQELVAAGASISVRTVQRATARLELAGLLLIDRGRGRTSNRYRALFPYSVVASQSRHNEPLVATLTPRSSDFDDRSSDTGVTRKLLKLSKAHVDDAVPLESGSSSTCEGCGLGSGHHLADCPTVRGDE